MDNYRNRMNEIRASDALRQATLERIHREEQEPDEGQKNRPGRVRIWLPLISLAAAACLLLVIGLPRQQSLELTYHTVPKTMVRTLPQDSPETMTAEQYSDYLGLAVLDLLEEGQLLGTEVSLERENGQILRDSYTARYNVGGKSVVLQLSKTDSLVPESLRQVEPVGDYAVVAGVSEDGRERVAAFRWKNGSGSLLSRKMEQQEFETLLFGLLAKLEK